MEFVRGKGKGEGVKVEEFMETPSQKTQLLRGLMLCLVLNKSLS